MKVAFSIFVTSRRGASRRGASRRMASSWPQGPTCRINIFFAKYWRDCIKPPYATTYKCN